jgi:hypothetical protein
MQNSGETSTAVVIDNDVEPGDLTAEDATDRSGQTHSHAIMLAGAAVVMVGPLATTDRLAERVAMGLSRGARLFRKHKSSDR